MSLNLADIRQDYSKKELSPEDCLPDAVAQFEVWLNEAMTAQVHEPTAMNVATVGADGRPTARIVLLKGVENGQLVFYTNYLSRKGQQLADNPFVSITFFWPELERQVRWKAGCSKWPRGVRRLFCQPSLYQPAGCLGQRAEQRNQLQERAGQPRRHVWRQASTACAAPAALGRLRGDPGPVEFWQGAPAVCTTAWSTCCKPMPAGKGATGPLMLPVAGLQF
jgi:pyridoxamine 5'-phosphate oxidase